MTFNMVILVVLVGLVALVALALRQLRALRDLALQIVDLALQIEVNARKARITASNLGEALRLVAIQTGVDGQRFDRELERGVDKDEPH